MIFQPRYSPYLLGASLLTTEYITALLLSQFNLLSSSEAMKVLSSFIELMTLPLDHGCLIIRLVKEHSRGQNTHTSEVGTRAVFTRLLAVPATSRSSL